MAITRGIQTPRRMSGARRARPASPLRPDMTDPAERRRIRVLVRALPPTERLIIHARFGFLLPACTYDEIAAGLDISVSEVRRHEQRALCRLRAFYGLGEAREAA